MTKRTLSSSHKEALHEGLRRYHERRRAEGTPWTPFGGRKVSAEHQATLVESVRRRHRERPTQGENHPNWKGDDASYTTKHQWAQRWIPLTGTCQCCGSTEKTTEHANVDHCYRRVVEDWLELCRSCHRKMDKAASTPTCNAVG